LNTKSDKFVAAPNPPGKINASKSFRGQMEEAPKMSFSVFL